MTKDCRKTKGPDTGREFSQDRKVWLSRLQEWSQGRESRRPKLQARNQIIWMKNSDTTRNGMSILMRSNAPIRNGLKIATKHRIEEGSKLFKLEILPVAKKE